MRNSRPSADQVRAIARVVREHKGKHSSRDPDTNNCAVCKLIPDAIRGVEMLEAEVAEMASVTNSGEAPG
jgi:hypothetical protein